METKSNYRWVVVAIFFGFMLLHQTDRLLIGPMTDKIQTEFGITNTQMGAISFGALFVGAICYPIWGYLYDRYSRAKLLAMASFIWGATTWFNALARSYPMLFISRSSTGIDDSSYPGLYSLITDYFKPTTRGKIYGLLQLTQPLGYLIGMILGLMLSGIIGWRAIFYITGSLGVVVSILIYFGVKEAPRGQSEPEMAGIDEIGIYRFDWQTAKDLFKKPSLRLLFIQGFFGVFPWNAITIWFFVYLQRERGYTDSNIMITMAPAVLVLAFGYPFGGALGDYFFKRNPSGRLIVSTIGVLVGAILLWITLSVPTDNHLLFMIMLLLTALFIPIAAPNVISSVNDITLPEVRSTAQAVQSFIESIGAAFAPLIVGAISDQLSLKAAFLIICIATWIICAIFFALAARMIPKDIELLRSQMRQRAEFERQKALGITR